MSSVHEAVKTWKEKVAAAKSEASAINTVLAGLASHGYAHKPSVGSARQDGVNFRLYHWADTPFGDLILVTGPSVESQLLIASELLSTPQQGMIYIAVGADTSKAKDRVGEKLKGKRIQTLLAKAKDEGLAAPKPKTPKATTTTPKAPRTPRAPKQKEPVVTVVEAPSEMDRFRAARAAGRQRFTEQKAAGVYDQRKREHFGQMREAGRAQFQRKAAAGAYDVTRAQNKAERDAEKKKKALAEMNDMFAAFEV